MSKRIIIIPDVQVKPGQDFSFLHWAGKYEAYIHEDYKKIHLGIYITAEEANIKRLDYLRIKYGNKTTK